MCGIRSNILFPASCVISCYAICYSCILHGVLEVWSGFGNCFCADYDYEARKLLDKTIVTKRYCNNDFLGGGFKHFWFSPLPGEMIQFDKFSNGLKPPTSYVINDYWYSIFIRSIIQDHKVDAWPEEMKTKMCNSTFFRKTGLSQL